MKVCILPLLLASPDKAHHTIGVVVLQSPPGSERDNPDTFGGVMGSEASATQGGYGGEAGGAGATGSQGSAVLAGRTRGNPEGRRRPRGGSSGREARLLDADDLRLARAGQAGGA